MLMLLSLILEAGQMERRAECRLGRLGGAVLHDGDVEPDRAHRVVLPRRASYPVTSLSPITLLSPLFGIFFGVTLLNDQLTAAHAASAAR